VSGEELPAGWVEVKLGDVAEVVRAIFDPSATPEKIVNYISLEWVESGTGQEPDAHLTAGKDIGSAKIAFVPGDVLYGKLRPYLRKVFIATRGGAAVTDLVPLRARGCVDARLIKYLLLSPIHDDYIAPLMKGIGMPRLGIADLENMPLALPPLPEQRRIVAKLDELRACSQKARAALDEVPALLEKLKQSVLAAAFQGDLTAEWRAAQAPGSVEPASALLERIRAERRARWEQANPKKKYEEPEPVDTDGLPELPEGWCWVSFATLVDGIRSGTATTAVRENTGFRVLRSSAVRPGTIDFGDYSFLPAAPHPNETVAVGDLLVTRLSGSLSYVGNGALVSVLPDSQLAYPDRLFRSRPHPDIASWLAMSLGVKFLRLRLELKAKSSAGHQRISQGDLLQFAVPLPPIAEQCEALRAITRVLAGVVALADDATVCQDTLVSLDQAILAKAFRGELVPQDPNDEPAAQLLARIQAEAAAPQAKRAGPGRPRRAG
jgi:type I restriction enzyme S subunit